MVAAGVHAGDGSAARHGTHASSVCIKSTNSEIIAIIIKIVCRIETVAEISQL